MTSLPVPRPGEDIVPTDWWKNQIVPWADEQTDPSALTDASARLAGLEAAYRVLGADTLELTKGRRYLEVRWGVLLGPGADVKTGPGLNASLASEALHRMDRSRFREMAWKGDRPVRDLAFEILDRRGESDALTRAKLLGAIREALAERRRGEPVDDLITADVEIRLGDFREVLQDLCGTVDAIITDPPYEAEFVPMFDDLGELAANLLTVDGVLAVMCGQTYLPQYLDHLSTWLEYRWTAAYLTPGPATRIYHASVAAAWKPVLIFHRPGAQHRFFLDVFRSGGDDKGHHHWGQSESGMAALVDRLTEPGQLVVDPCVGGGTTAVVCRDLKRRFAGCDLDAAAIHETRDRLGMAS